MRPKLAEVQSKCFLIESLILLDKLYHSKEHVGFFVNIPFYLIFTTFTSFMFPKLCLFLCMKDFFFFKAYDEVVSQKPIRCSIRVFFISM